MAQRDLYFDIYSEKWGGSLYKLQDENGNVSFLFEHSISDEATDEIKVFKTPYISFNSFWQELIKTRWFYMHPLYVHKEIRPFIQKELQGVNWQVEGNLKWQESHRRQWKKVLTDSDFYYRAND